MNETLLQADLSKILNKVTIHRNLGVPELVEKSIFRQEGVLCASGALSVTTRKYTGRSPNDRFIVKEHSVEQRIAWSGVNRPLSTDTFERLYHKVIAYLGEKDELFSFTGFAGVDKQYRLPLQVINEFAWQNLLVHQLFVRPDEDELQDLEPGFTVICAPGFQANHHIDGTNSEAFIVLSFEHRIVLIGGTHYAGEIKKSVFSVMNYLLPEQGVLSMHCSANVGQAGDVALFFGLSGTGKTTLSADPNRMLIGDDEHGWSSSGIFNIEGGCYAKCVNLSQQKEPQIWDAIRFGAVVENVVLGKERIPNYSDVSLTENTRAAYPLHYIPGAKIPSSAEHPKVIVFLTADAFGVLPPVSRLNKEQAMYHFLSGYTSKLAGTERGIKEPEATFSTCFGAPFLPLSPSVYVQMLGEKISAYGSKVYLVNTGWSGGPYGVGERMRLEYTRLMVDAILSGAADQVETTIDPVFRLAVLTHCPGVPSEILTPRETWSDKVAYDRQARELARAFHQNFAKFAMISEEIRSAGPEN